MGLNGNRNFNMIGKDGREYNIDIIIRESGSVDFTVKDIATRAVVDDGWFVISKNGTLRVERVK